jgi:hypothetical protein
MAGEGLIEQKVLLVIPTAHRWVLPAHKSLAISGL